jgi:hypothetical protein
MTLSIVDNIVMTLSITKDFIMRLSITTDSITIISRQNDCLTSLYKNRHRNDIQNHDTLRKNDNFPLIQNVLCRLAFC